MKKLWVLSWMLFAVCAAYGQTWFKVATEDASGTLTIPANSTYRFGAGACWSVTTTVATATTFSPIWYSSFPFPDPCPGQTKELDLLETVLTQSVSLDGGTLIVPSLPTCPAGIYGEIAGGKPGMTALVPAGVLYRLEPATACSTSPTDTIVDMSSGNLDVLRVATPVSIVVNPGSVLPSPITFDPTTYDGSTQVSTVSFLYTIGGVTLNCTTDPANGVSVTCAVMPIL